jgi:YfiH family protein
LILNAVGEVLYYTFPSLSAFEGLTHAVSTRHGGVSKPPFATLNLTWKSGDEPLAVEQNHQRLLGALGIFRDTMVSPRQVHSARVRRVGTQHRGRFIADCDALITRHSEVALVLRYADCVPIFLFDPRRRVIGLVHAGWRGTVASIAGAAVDSMGEWFGCQPRDLVAGIGPAIGPCCYEVGPDVAAEVEATFGQGTDVLRVSAGPGDAHPGQSARSPSVPTSSGADRPRQQQGESLYFDLWAANELQLRAAGVSAIEVARLCTACHQDEFFSYRAANGRTGHHGALMCLRE